ncbi:MAG: TRZ/ATZ family hydrolase [Gammaproteobacteria bacterium]|nr:TRZ/ATZ family hydrolase [Gammaproteobacteria bacterium]
MNNVDLIVEAAWVATVDAGDTLLTDHAVVVNDTRIVDILPRDAANAGYRANLRYQLPTHLLIPGLVNAHTHAAMTLLRGFADDIPLMAWLQEHVWPTESRWVDKDFVRDGTQLAIAEMLRSGTTCFSDMYYHPDIAATVAQASGIRAIIGMIVLDFPTLWAADPDEYFHKGLTLHDQLRDDPLVGTALAPHAPYTVSDGPLARVRMYTDELDIPVHMHVHETRHEVQQAIDETGSSPLRRLQRLGMLNPHLIAVHMTQLQDDDIELAARSGINVVHCPESNLKLASGFCRVNDLLNAGVNVALGTDGAASNNDLDMLGELRCAALLAKGIADDASALEVTQALRMATINGARALGIADQTGSLEVGKSADMVALDLHALNTQPVYNAISQLVFAASREQICHVWVAGECLVEDAKLTRINEAELLHKIAAWGQRMQAGA